MFLVVVEYCLDFVNIGIDDIRFVVIVVVVVGGYFELYVKKMEY